eukprot:TRINITY_DN4365_c0_g2_i1.p1 TRINITY_DN4365_c0_g2~~TRINITY_DN4365_c0_g2_i1.p1  ORF type:complete len:1231 (+),score=306.57 TRINITY_DN4365_c0_g2_i1:338-4030(+)
MSSPKSKSSRSHSGDGSSGPGSPPGDRRGSAPPKVKKRAGSKSSLFGSLLGGKDSSATSPGRPRKPSSAPTKHRSSSHTDGRLVRDLSGDDPSAEPLKLVLKPRPLNQRILIIGASDGLGADLGRVVAGRKIIGLKLALVARNLSRLEAVAEECRSKDPNATVRVVQADVTSPVDIRNMVGQVVSEFGGVDVLVYACGLGLNCLLADIRELGQAFHHILDVNFYGAVECLHACLPHLLESKSGGQVLVFSTSDISLLPLRTSLYAASKAALISFCDSLRTEHPSLNVTVATPYVQMVPNESDTEALDVPADVAAAAGPLPVIVEEASRDDGDEKGKKEKEKEKEKENEAEKESDNGKEKGRDKERGRKRDKGDTENGEKGEKGEKKRGHSHKERSGSKSRRKGSSSKDREKDREKEKEKHTEKAEALRTYEEGEGLSTVDKDAIIRPVRSLSPSRTRASSKNGSNGYTSPPPSPLVSPTMSPLPSPVPTRRRSSTTVTRVAKSITFSSAADEAILALEAGLSNCTIGATVVRTSRRGTQATHTSITKNTLLRNAVLQGQEKRVKQIIKTGGRDLKVDERDHHGRTVVHDCVCLSTPQHIEILKLLLKKNPDLNSQDNACWTPLLLAASHQNTKAIKLILSKGADADMRSTTRACFIHLLCSQVPKDNVAARGIFDSCKTALDHGCDVNAKNSLGLTALHEASSAGAGLVVQWLLKNDADPNMQDHDGETSLHCAVRANRLDEVRLLLEAGASAKLTNKAGLTAGELPCENAAIKTLVGQYASEELVANPRKTKHKIVNDEVWVTQKPKEQAKDDAKQAKREAKREVVVIPTWEDMPEKWLTTVRKYKLDDDLCKENFAVLLHCLKFVYRKNFCMEDPEAVEAARLKAEVDDGNTSEDSLDMIVDSQEDPLEIVVPGDAPPPKTKTRDTRPLEEHAEDVLSTGNPKKMFRMLEMSGKGGFGSVYFAKDLHGGRGRVALKKMPHKTPKQIRNNVDEIEFLRMCKQKNIVTYFNSYIVKQEIWLAMEHMEGGTLSEACAMSEFNEEQIAYLSREMLHGIRYLHNKNLVHRDLKSSNVMLSVQGDVKIIDFGLCVDSGSKVSLTHMVGSPFWIPPEMIRREPHSFPADIWSFAICVIELAMGQPPHRRSALRAMFLAATSDPPALPSGQKWSSVFRDFLDKCLKSDPAERQTVRQLCAHPFLKKSATRDSMQPVLEHVFLEKSIEMSLGVTLKN